MRTASIDKLEYEKYNAITKAIIKVMPFALVNQGYNKELKIGFWNFWDSDYIPPVLQGYIQRPPFHQENVNNLERMILQNFAVLEEE